MAELILMTSMATNWFSIPKEDLVDHRIFGMIDQVMAREVQMPFVKFGD